VPDPTPNDGAPATARFVVVWDWPLRLSHWLLAASVLIAWFTANVFDTVHEISGYTALGVLAFRLVWALVGNRYARFWNWVRPSVATLRYLGQLARGRPGRYLGLNPAGAAMAVVLLVLIGVSTISGWMQITVTFFGVAWVEHIHTWSSNLVLALVVVHVLGVLLMCWLQRENLIGGMITGRKRATDKDQSA